MILNADVKSLEWITYLFISQDKNGIQEWFDFVDNPKLNDIHTKNQHDSVSYTHLDVYKRQILFNGKFDLHWCNNIGIHFNVRQPIWDCQLAEFILSNQRWKYPSLDEACEKRGIGKKIDTIKLKYWNNNIDTDMIPPAELEEYLQQDVSLTYKLYLAQLAEFKKPEHASKYKLCLLYTSRCV